MVLDAFVFESDRSKARAIASVRLGTDEEIESLIHEIRKQGNAREFPIILRQILTEAVKVGGKIKPDQLSSLSREVNQLKAKGPEIRKFKRGLKDLIQAAEEKERPIVF